MAQRQVRTRKTTPAAKRPSGWDRFYRVIRSIPRGRVTTYGAIAVLAGQPAAARQVGFALAALIDPHANLPWHRVLGARGRGFAAVTIREPSGAALQRKLLEAEGVCFDSRGRVPLTGFGWRKTTSRARPA
jgi:methylated-DNA-protein-cysteine methyltransferase-like protein